MLIKVEIIDNLQNLTIRKDILVNVSFFLFLGVFVFYILRSGYYIE